MTQPPPFAYQAAKASWVAPIVASVLNFGAKTMLAGGTQMSPDTSRIIWMVVGGLSTLIVAAGLLLGIAALFAIKRHGWRGILLPSTIGILLCSGYLYMLISTILFVRQLAAERGIS